MSRRDLSPKQLACLRHFASVEHDHGWSFGSGTLTSLRKLGLLEKFQSETNYTRWRATAAGRERAWVAP